MTAEIDNIREIFDVSPFLNHMGTEIVDCPDGSRQLELVVRDELLNVNKTVHGGVYATLLDTIIGITIRSQVQKPVATMNLTIHYLAPISEGKMIATANILQAGYRTVIAEAMILDNTGKLLSKASGTFKVSSK